MEIQNTTPPAEITIADIARKVDAAALELGIPASVILDKAFEIIKTVEEGAHHEA